MNTYLLSQKHPSKSKTIGELVDKQGRTYKRPLWTPPTQLLILLSLSTNFSLSFVSFFYTATLLSSFILFFFLSFLSSLIHSIRQTQFLTPMVPFNQLTYTPSFIPFFFLSFLPFFFPSFLFSFLPSFLSSLLNVDVLLRSILLSSSFSLHFFSSFFFIPYFFF